MKFLVLFAVIFSGLTGCDKIKQIFSGDSNSTKVINEKSAPVLPSANHGENLCADGSEPVVVEGDCAPGKWEVETDASGLYYCAYTWQTPKLDCPDGMVKVSQANHCSEPYRKKINVNQKVKSEVCEPYTERLPSKSEAMGCCPK